MPRELYRRVLDLLEGEGTEAELLEALEKAKAEIVDRVRLSTQQDQHHMGD